jgi:hypothetical protein
MCKSYEYNYILTKKVAPRQSKKLHKAVTRLRLLWTNFFFTENQGCQMIYFQTKNPNLGKFWRVLQWKMSVYVFYEHLVSLYFMDIW